MSPLDPNEGVALGLKGMGGIQKLQFRVPDSPMVTGVFSTVLRTNTLTLIIHPKAQEILNNIGNTSPTSSGLGSIAEYDSKNSFELDARIQPCRGTSLVAMRLAGSHSTKRLIWKAELLGVKQGSGT
ncbi:hypothetical protein O9992_18595 [Vibrio lentus]|nr:hypothetical protein [Vibrio lentus]